MKERLLQGYFRLLWYFAKKYLKKHKPYIIWINGSVGKTSCRMIVYQTLQQFLPNQKTYSSPKNFNGELWLSLSIFQVEERNPTIFCFIQTFLKLLSKTVFWRKSYDILVLEYGIDHPGEMDFLLQIAKPDMWIFTAIDAVHSEQFGNPDNIAKDEMKMVKNTKEIAFLNIDDVYSVSLIPQIKIDYFTYQTLWIDSKADITFWDEYFKKWEWKNVVEVDFDLHIKKQKYEISTNIFGKPHYWYIWVALTIADILNYKFGNTKSSIISSSSLAISYQLQPWRFSIFHWKQDSILVDSTYNSSPKSVRSIIDTVFHLRKNLFPKRKVRLVLGDMRELWDLTEREHRILAGYVSQMADKLFLVGKSMIEYLSDELNKFWYDKTKVYEFTSSTKAGQEILSQLKSEKEEIILIFKWSQNTIFLEETVKLLLSNHSDQKYLTRQSDRRLAKKKSMLND